MISLSFGLEASIAAPGVAVKPKCPPQLAQSPVGLHTDLRNQRCERLEQFPLKLQLPGLTEPAFQNDTAGAYRRRAFVAAVARWAAPGVGPVCQAS